MAQTQLHAEVLSANEKYASEFGAKADLALPPGRQAAFIVCMVFKKVCLGSCMRLLGMCVSVSLCV